MPKLKPTNCHKKYKNKTKAPLFNLNIRQISKQHDINKKATNIKIKIKIKSEAVNKIENTKVTRKTKYY